MQAQEAKKNPWISAYDSDLAVHKRNKAGKVVAERHYRMHCIGDVTVFEVPPQSGNLFYERDGVFAEPAGRLIQIEEEVTDPKTKKVRKYKTPSIDFAATHVAVKEDAIAPAEERNASLEAELRALRAEKEILEKRIAAAQPKEPRK